MSKLIITYIILLITTSLSCDAVYRLLDKNGAEEKKLIGEAVPFEANPTVEEIQKLLTLYGYNAGAVDGVLGLRTRNAIEKFQRENNLEQTRVVDQQTWAKLKIFKQNGLVLANDDLNAILVQTLLTKAGYDIGKPDGKIGPKTMGAIKKFQKANGLNPDGKVGYKTLVKLSEYLDESAIQIQPVQTVQAVQEEDNIQEELILSPEIIE